MENNNTLHEETNTNHCMQSHNRRNNRLSITHKSTKRQQLTRMTEPNTQLYHGGMDLGPFDARKPSNSQHKGNQNRLVRTIQSKGESKKDL